MLGHKDHGKSTLLGRLLIATGSVSKERVEEAKRISNQLGRRFEPGFILDAFAEERKGGLTIDTTRAELKYKGIGFEFIDVPGHEELIKNMLTGASNASTAVLVVSAKPGEGITSQTKRHVFLARLLGISRIVVAINKIDAVAYRQEAYESIKKELAGYLEKIGFAKQAIGFVPISAYNNENLVSKSRHMKWYKGKPLMDLLVSAVRKQNHASNKPARVLLQDRLEGMVTGRVLSGSIKQGDRLLLLPDNKMVSIGKVVVAGKAAKKASAGASVALSLSCRIAGEVAGRVLCQKNRPAAVAKSIKAELFLIEKVGKSFEIVLNGSAIRASVKSISTIDTSTGELAKRKPNALDAAIAELRLSKPAALERFSFIQELGRFTIHTKRGLSGIGIVLDADAS